MLPSDNFFQKSMSIHILNGPFQRTFDVYILYIDDLDFQGKEKDDFIIKAREIFNICRDKGVIRKKLVIGMGKGTLLGKDIDSKGLNMTAPCIASVIDFAKPSTLKELMSFLGLVN